MEAAAAEEVSTIMKSSPSREQLAQIVKGKRTKRQRPQSPIPFVVSTNSISGTGGDGGEHKSDNVNNHANLLLSPASSAEYMDSTEEDEDMANCLILLAQCQSRDSPPKQQQQQQHDNDHIVIQSKFNSRKFLEAPSTGNGKAGYYVYECKTCNRTFPSFQALGGHRASHKKPKAAAAAINNHDRRLSNFIVSSDEEETGNFKNVFHQLSHRGNLYSSSNNNNNKSIGKIHECSICGAEFTSGQALGGHMRGIERRRQRNQEMCCLDLDLNLPAPEDDLRESKLPFASKQQQSQQQQQQQQNNNNKNQLLFSQLQLWWIVITDEKSTKEKVISNQTDQSWLHTELVFAVVRRGWGGGLEEVDGKEGENGDEEEDPRN
ncbi:hypothetical protein LWI28_021604 [Acer negundo]|uniref:C2H2-type domain-containing protein n=1 Tax=Acer negundo TaxID=4023 RepID=A0AAD5IBG4_ACENE|nr:hypothetical protein LWI28_021604 [Acer negundo]